MAGQQGQPKYGFGWPDGRLGGLGPPGSTTPGNIMRVLRSRKPLQHFYSLGNEILQEVSDAKYLGIQIDNKLDWNKHISTVAARGQSKLAFLNRNLKGCPKKLRDTAYISLIRPALDSLGMTIRFSSCKICIYLCIIG